MKEKVYLNRINVDYQALYARAKDYFHRHGVEISFDFIPCDYKNLTYRIANFPQGQRIILQPSMSNVVPIDLSYDFTSFAFNGMEFIPPNIPTGYCYCPVKQPFIDINLDERTPEANYLLICHEHMHALVIKANQAGFPTQDVMDTYYNNQFLDSADSNFGRQWQLLQPFVKSLQGAIPPTTPTLPRVTIKRAYQNENEVLGDLTYEYAYSYFTCKTLELPDKNNAPSISCIPKGMYRVSWTWSWKFMRYTYEIQNIPGRSGIRFHPANFFFDLKGCIALGDKYGNLNGDQWADIINSKATVAKFEQLIAKRDFQLEIL